MPKVLINKHLRRVSSPKFDVSPYAVRLYDEFFSNC